MHATASATIASNKLESVIHFRASIFSSFIIHLFLIELHQTLFVRPDCRPDMIELAMKGWQVITRPSDINYRPILNNFAPTCTHDDADDKIILKVYIACSH